MNWHSIKMDCCLPSSSSVCILPRFGWICLVNGITKQSVHSKDTILYYMQEAVMSTVLLSLSCCQHVFIGNHVLCQRIRMCLWVCIGGWWGDSTRCFRWIFQKPQFESSFSQAHNCAYRNNHMIPLLECTNHTNRMKEKRWKKMLFFTV